MLFSGHPQVGEAHLFLVHRDHEWLNILWLQGQYVYLTDTGSKNSYAVRRFGAVGHHEEHFV